MRTMNWPPKPVNGRIPWVQGVEAASVAITMVVADLRNNPFNPPDLSFSDIVFKVRSSNKARLQEALARLSPIVSIESVEEELGEGDTVRYIIKFIDRESRMGGEVRVG